MILEAEDVDQLERCTTEILGLQDPSYCYSDCITLDYYVSGLWWCRQQNFTAEETSVFFAILEKLLKNIQKQMCLVDVIMDLKQIVVRTCYDGREPSSPLGRFSSGQSMNFICYFHTSLFQHYKLYEYFFQCPPQEFIVGLDLAVETPKAADVPWPAPLVESVSEDVMGQLHQNLSTQEIDQEEQQKAALKKQAEADARREEALLCQLSPEEVLRIINSVYCEMLPGVEEEIAAKIRDQENAFINRINRIRVVKKR